MSLSSSLGLNKSFSFCKIRPFRSSDTQRFSSSAGPNQTGSRSALKWVNERFLCVVPAAETRLHHEQQHHASYRQTGTIWNQRPTVLFPAHRQDLVRRSVRLYSHSAHHLLRTWLGYLFCYFWQWYHIAKCVHFVFLPTDTLMAYWNKISPQDIMNFLSLLEWVANETTAICKY